MKAYFWRIGSFCLLALSPLLWTSCNSDPHTYAMIETEFGNMKVMLYNTTPAHRDNFIKLVQEEFYDDLLFHRVIDNFMIQGGDPQSRGAGAGQVLGGGGPGYTIPHEIGAPLLKGALATARLGDNVNPQKESSGSQFFIVEGRPQNAQQLSNIERQKGIQYNETQKRLYQEVGGYPSLDGDYTVFGEVVEGLEVIDKISMVQTDRNNRPTEDVKMKIRLLN